MKLVSGNTFWTKKSKIPTQYPYLDHNETCDILVVGAGLTGAITAYHLCELGKKVILIDKNIAGYQSTSASTAIAQYEIDTDLLPLSAMIGKDNATKCFLRCHKALYDLESIIGTLDSDCEFEKRECLYYSKNPSTVPRLKKEYEARKNIGLDVEWIDQNRGNQMFSFPIAGGIYSTTGAGDLNPYELTHQLLTYLTVHGGSVYENTNLVDVRSNELGVIGHTNYDFSIQAQNVIFTVGYDIKNWIPSGFSHLYRTFTCITQPFDSLPGWHNACIIRDTKDPYTYLRITKDHRILIGGEDEKMGNQDSNMANLCNDSIASQKKFNILLERLKSYFPQLPNPRFEYTFSGLFADTKDSLPYVGKHPKFPHCYFNLGYGANGILYSVIGAQLIRDSLQGKDDPLLHVFSFER